MRNWIDVYLGLGSNVGNRGKNIRAALRRLKEDPDIRVVKFSRLYETSPVGPSQRKFVNAAALIQTRLSPLKLLSCLQETERALGRRKIIPKGPRTLDLDILTFGRRKVRSAELEIPHPEIRRRRFVLVPLAEIAPELIIPGIRGSVRSLSVGLTDPAQKVMLMKSHD